jgi:hypothetical protein
MDPISTFTIPPILKQAVEHRIEGLEHAKESFKRRYRLNTHCSTELNVSVRISKLLEDIEKFDLELEDEDEQWTSETIKRVIEQAQGDKSISETRLLDLEKRLQSRLNKHLHRIEVSCLHAALMREAMDADVSIEEAATKLEASSMDGDFEMVEEQLEGQVEQFKKDIIIPTNVDPEAIQAYLSSMFTGDEEDLYLQDVRNKMQTYGKELANGNMEIGQVGLTWAITNLIENDSISPRAKETLRAYLQSPSAFQELAATLKMKTVRNFSHKNAETGLSITARRNAEGRYDVTVEEDIIDMLFLHCTAMGWASNLKECLKDSPYTTDIFVSTPLPQLELDKRSYFLGPWTSKDGMRSMHYPFNPMGPPLPPMTQMTQPFVSCVMAPPPPMPSVNAFFQKDLKIRRSHSHMVPMAPPPPFHPDLGELDSERKRNYLRDFFMWRLPTHDGCTPKVSPLEDVQAKLIKTLAVELTLREAFDGEIHASVRKFDSLASSMPHDHYRGVGIPWRTGGLLGLVHALSQDQTECWAC